MSDSVRPHRRQPMRLPHPWDSPGKDTGVGCHFFLQCMKVKSESEVTQSCPTLSNPKDCSLPGSSVHGLFQARILEWGAIAFSMNVPFQINILDVTWSENLTVCFTCWILSISLSMNLPLECKYFLHDTCCEDPLSTTEKMLKLNVHATKNDT